MLELGVTVEEVEVLEGLRQEKDSWTSSCCGLSVKTFSTPEYPTSNIEFGVMLVSSWRESAKRTMDKVS